MNEVGFNDVEFHPPEDEAWEVPVPTREEIAAVIDRRGENVD